MNRGKKPSAHQHFYSGTFPRQHRSRYNPVFVTTILFRHISGPLLHMTAAVLNNGSIIQTFFFLSFPLGRGVIVSGNMGGGNDEQRRDGSVPRRHGLPLVRGFVEQAAGRQHGLGRSQHVRKCVCVGGVLMLDHWSRIPTTMPGRSVMPAGGVV